MRDRKKIAVLIVLLLLVVLVEYRFHLTSYVVSGKAMEDIRGMREENPMLSVIIYLIFAFLGSSLLALPGITFALIAGVVFGPYLGTLLCVIGTSLGAALSFILGRYFLKDTVKPMVMKNQYIRRFLFESEGKNDIYLLMVTRLVPLFPFNLQNFAYGITDMKFSTYALFSTLFIVPGTAIYTFATSGILDQEKRWLYLALATVLFALLGLLGKYIKEKAEIQEYK